MMRVRLSRLARRANRWGLAAGCGAVVVLALTSAALAEEIIVQNDSVTDFGQAVIVGDFVGGEMAGTRLTSPCNGTIVGVQVLWLEGTAGHGESLEEAIHIYADDGPGFPTPGTELALLEGPVMTPGYMNEFRYLDEAQTMPVNVPVTAGQHFYVAFEFYNATDVGNGSPSVVRDTNGCQANSNVLYGDLGLGRQWYNFCLLISGDLAIRAIIDCPGATGACCDENAICTNDVEEGDCSGAFDTWFEGQTCAQVTCPTPTGACCNGVGGCLDGLEEAVCEDPPYNGIYGGNGTTCSDPVCDVGACCMPDGGCLDVIEPVCVSTNGAFQGAGTTCATTDCPQPTGACCIGESCSIQTEENCTGFGGNWLGMETDCDPNPCEITLTMVAANTCRLHDEGGPLEQEICFALGTGGGSRGTFGDNVEMRTASVKKLVVTLDGTAPDSPTAAVDCTPTAYGGAVSALGQTPSADQVTVEFDPGLPDQCCCEVTIGGVGGSWWVGTLVGDANQDGDVTALDYSYVKLRLGAPVAQNPKADINADADITGLDYSSIKLRLGHTLASPCPAAP